MSGRQQRVMVQPINVIFKHLQSKTPVIIWLYDNVEMRIHGRIIGFDEYMNVVMDDATEVYAKEDRPSVPLGELFLVAGLWSERGYRENSSQRRKYYAHSAANIMRTSRNKNPPDRRKKVPAGVALCCSQL
ncbi:mRNA splicing protein sme1 [Serendipita sp. 397]|nr:mRNA splicing protein sme1 [Serendipita sp. 397]